MASDERDRDLVKAQQGGGRQAGARVRGSAAFGYPFVGAKLIYRQHPALVRYWGPPIVLAGLAMGLAGYFVLEHRQVLLNALWPLQAGDGSWLSAFVHGVRAVVGFIVTVLALGVSIVAALFAAQVVAAPFHDALSEAVEALHRGRPAATTTLSTLLRDAVRSVQLVLVKLAIYAALMLPLWALSLLLPVVGPALHAALGFSLTIAFLSLDHVDWAAARHGFSVSQRIALLRQHPAALLPFGLSVWCLLFVPIVNLFLIPAAVAGGTLLFLDLGLGDRGEGNT